MEKHLVQVSVENGKLIGLGNANPYFNGNYTSERTQTYYGEALAVVRAGSAGVLKITVSDGEHSEHIEIPCKA